MTSPALIELQNVSIRAGAFGLRSVSLQVDAGSYAVVMGRSGSGKTTLLEAICGLRAVDAGCILIAGRDVTRRPPRDRGIGFVPQETVLFSQMTVAENLAFSLVAHRWSQPAIRKRVAELAELLRIGELLDRRPRGLSGGEAQRVALGRALAGNPSVLCLDEPLSALDDETRDEMYDVLLQVQHSAAVTTLHVTHSRVDMQRLADRLFVLEGGDLRTAHLVAYPSLANTALPSSEPHESSRRSASSG